ncbi:MAG: hypothetical protein AAGC83_09390 [Pseudomonadota bacterium]
MTTRAALVQQSAAMTGRAAMTSAAMVSRAAMASAAMASREAMVKRHNDEEDE